jgi:hypothetical protein
VDEVRARIRRLTMPACTEVASTALTLETAADVWQLVTDQCPPSLP